MRMTISVVLLTLLSMSHTYAGITEQSLSESKHSTSAPHSLIQKDPLFQDTSITGVACFISDAQGRVLVTRDILNNRIAIPGGYVDTDNPRDAAIRETFEETGIRVKVMGELVRLRNAVLFDCVALTPIPIHDPIKSSTVPVAAWQAEHFGREVRAVMMMTPDEVLLKNARFPEQVSLFPDLLKKATSSETQHFDDFSNMASVFTVWNAGHNRAFQSIIENLPDTLSNLVSSLLFYASILGDGALFFLLIPFAMATGGLKRTSQLLFVTVLVTTLTHFGKLFFAIPRPLYVFPDLQLDVASGFAFPSGHTATAFAVWGLVYLWLKHAGKNHLWIWLVPAILVGLSRVYLGVHYITDVMAGAVVGVLSLALAQYCTQKQCRGESLILRARLWIVLALLLMPLAATQIQPTFLYCTLFSLSFALCLCVNHARKMQCNTPTGRTGFLWSLSGLILIAAGTYTVAQWSSSSIEILITNALATIFLAVWLALITPMMYQRK